MHPRKIYYYLTTIPRQNLPADSSDLFTEPNAAGKGGKRIISPSVSSASVDEDTEAAEERKRDAMSPSPEVDLSSHDIDGGTNGTDTEFRPNGLASFSSRSNSQRDSSNHSTPDGVAQRTASPPLEGDEREFTQTASSVRMRGMSLDEHSVRPSIDVIIAPEVEQSEEDRARLNREEAETLFGTHHPQLLASLPGSSPRNSPLVRPMQLPQADKPTTLEPNGEDVTMQESWTGSTWDSMEPEDIQIEDLDDLFGAC